MSNTVAPYVGAWIETSRSVHYYQLDQVAPYVGAWIETSFSIYAKSLQMSHPTWVRGLKLDLKTGVTRYKVAPYVGAWIETTKYKQVY